jgi:predicted amidophosphoribosyltransferase
MSLKYRRPWSRRDDERELVDDAVGSGWTLTVVAALLTRAGVTAVWPVALAAATAGD